VASPILRETIKKLKARRALLLKQVKGPLAEIAQIEADLVALGAGRETRRSGSRPRAPRGATQSAVLRAIRNGATTPPEIAEKTAIAPATVSRALAAATKARLVTRGATGLTLTKPGRERLAELEAGK
jgi:predicted Rossmann fold nucleotide-binding protein DprA/Smf involved in DNA uptake